jgi:hypothetical protein
VEKVILYYYEKVKNEIRAYRTGREACVGRSRDE